MGLAERQRRDGDVVNAKETKREERILIILDPGAKTLRCKPWLASMQAKRMLARPTHRAAILEYEPDPLLLALPNAARKQLSM
jgi:hypothetical protein